jgi:hypothetical protein
MDNQENKKNNGGIEGSIFRSPLTVFLAFVLGIWSLFSVFLYPAVTTPWSNQAFLDLPFLQMIEVILSWYLSPLVIYLMITVLIGLVLAYQFTSNYFSYIHGNSIGLNSTSPFWIWVFGIPAHDIVNIGIKSMQDRRIHLLEEVGGPSKISIGAENAIIVESPHKAVQIVGPTMNLPGGCFIFRNFEILKHVVDLQNQTFRLDIDTRTKDGMRIFFKDIRITYSIDRDSQPITLTRPYPYDSHSIYHLFYQNPLNDIARIFEETIKQEIVSMVRQYKSDVFHPTSGGDLVNEQINYSTPSASGFRKRKKYEFLLQNPKIAFQNNHLKRKSLFYGRIHKGFYRPFLDTSSVKSGNIFPRQNIQKENPEALIKNIGSHLEKRMREMGFQIYLCSFGSIELSDMRKSNLSSEIENSNNWRSTELADPIRLQKSAEQKEILSIIKTMGDLQSQHANQEIINTLRSFIETNSKGKKDQKRINDRPVITACKNIDQHPTDKKI